MQVTAPVWGEGPSTSLIVNRGNGTDAFIVLTGYHSVFRDFKVQGDCDPNHPQANSCRTRDGIVLDVDKSYLRFENVHASFHGRHGLYQRASWATSWTNSSERTRCLIEAPAFKPARRPKLGAWWGQSSCTTEG